jgi:hypothetical protein
VRCGSCHEDRWAEHYSTREVLLDMLETEWSALWDVCELTFTLTEAGSSQKLRLMA